jgi:hypothetical protein
MPGRFDNMYVTAVDAIEVSPLDGDPYVEGGDSVLCGIICQGSGIDFSTLRLVLAGVWPGTRDDFSGLQPRNPLKTADVSYFPNKISISEASLGRLGKTPSLNTRFTTFNIIFVLVFKVVAPDQLFLTRDFFCARCYYGSTSTSTVTQYNINSGLLYIFIS